MAPRERESVVNARDSMKFWNEKLMHRLVAAISQPVPTIHTAHPILLSFFLFLSLSLFIFVCFFSFFSRIFVLFLLVFLAF